MRWEDERYVRLYTRDTGDWLFLSFDAQALFCLILRKADRGGVLELGKLGREALPVMIGHRDAADRLQPALDALLADGCVILDGTSLVIRNYQKAQEARASDAQRKRDERERERSAASREVTACHEMSKPVTPSLAVPSLTSKADPDQKRIAQSDEKAVALAPAAALLAEFIRKEWPDVHRVEEYAGRAQAAFPGVDLASEARKARGWETANPRLAKKNHGRFLWNWFSRAQDGASQDRSIPRGVVAVPVRALTPSEQEARTKAANQVALMRSKMGLA